MPMSPMPRRRGIRAPKAPRSCLGALRSLRRNSLRLSITLRRPPPPLTQTPAAGAPEQKKSHGV